MASVYANSWAMIRTSLFSSGQNCTWWQYQQLKSTEILFPSHHLQNTVRMEVLSRKAQKPEKKSVPCLSWKSSACPSMLPSCGKPERTLSLLECLILFPEHAQAFYPLGRKMLPENQGNCTANKRIRFRKAENKPKNKSLKEERQQNLAGVENPEWIFISLFSSSKNLKPSALYKPWTCSNSSFVDFPDNRAAESHLIHLQDLVRTGKYNRLHNTWNCWHRKHFLTNSVGQQTQSRPCNYIPPWSTFAAV